MLDKFITTVRQKGLAKPTLFSVEIFKNFFSEDGATRIDNHFIVLMCQATELPGYNTQTVPHYTYLGNTREIPVQVDYEEIVLSFYLDMDLEVKKFFEQWLKKIFDPQTKTFGYPDDYTSNIRINQLDKEQNKVYSTILVDAFPKSISPIQVGHSMMGTISTLDVRFVYTKWATVQDVINRDDNPFAYNQKAETKRGFNGILSAVYEAKRYSDLIKANKGNPNPIIIGEILKNSKDIKVVL
jgi:hypothetical protein